MKASFLQKAKHFPQFTSMVPEAGRILTRAAQVQGLVRIDAVSTSRPERTLRARPAVA